MWREIVQMSLRPLSRLGRVSSMALRSPCVMFLNWRSRVVRNFTKSLALECSLLNEVLFTRKFSRAWFS